MGGEELRKRGSGTKKWNSIFSQAREVVDVSFYETYKTTRSKRGLVEAFLQEESSEVPSLQIERGRAFFTVSQDKIATWSSQARAWVYRHSKTGNIGSSGTSYLTTLQLSSLALKKQGRNVFRKGDINRVLVHLKTLTFDYGIALIQTVSQNNVAALRAALLGHIARATALRVTISYKGFETFRMELHLPYLTLRGSPPNSRFPNTVEDQRPTKLWADLSFLDRHIGQIDLTGRYIYAAHATTVISGWDCFKYTAYSFVDPGPAVSSAAEEPEDDDEDDDSEDTENLDPELLGEDAEDEFATYGWQDCLVVNYTSDPRVRFLRAVQIKVTVAKQECEYLIDFLCRIEDWVGENLFPTTSSLDTENSPRRLSQIDLNECVRFITTLLVKLRAHLAATIEALTKFHDDHGDIAYFADLSDPTADEAINSTRDAFKDFLGFEKKLGSMEETCKIWARKLDTSLTHDNHTVTRLAQDTTEKAFRLSRRMTNVAVVTFKAAEDTSRITHMSVYLVLATTPFIIALQYFTSDQKLFPFDRNVRTFCMSIVILMVVLFICACGLYSFDTYKSTLFWKIYAMLGGKQRERRKHLSDIAAEVLKPDYGEESFSATQSSATIV